MQNIFILRVCMHNAFCDHVLINIGQNEALGHCLRYIIWMKHCTLLETEGCPQSLPMLLSWFMHISSGKDEIWEVGTF